MKYLILGVGRKKLSDAFPDLSPADAMKLWKALAAATYEKQVDAALELANTMLGGYGIEAVRDGGRSNYYQDIGVLYVNMGDTYNTTILYDTRKERFYVTTLGDYIEKYEKRFRENPHKRTRKNPGGYKIHLTDQEVSALGWAADRGYYPTEAYDKMHLADGESEDGGATIMRTWIIPESAAWSISAMAEDDPDALFANLGGPLLSKLRDLEAKIV